MKLHLTGLLVLLLISSAPLSDVFAQERATQLKGPKNATSQYSGAVYGPIDASDTLWRIANRYRQNKELSVYQVMVAIYELNPEAFEQNNLNLLVDGAMLKLPSERYIARINAEQAQQRADQDEAEFARMQGLSEVPVNNLKPPIPLVNQDELSTTKAEFEQKITQLDSQQAEQFDALRQQFAASLDNVEVLLSENRKLYDRVEQVNTDLMNLKNQVEGDVQSQMDEQLALQHQLLDMIKQEQAQRKVEQSSSLMSKLTQPVSLVIGSGVLTLLLLGGLGFWLLKRKPANGGSEIMPTKTESPAVAPAAKKDDLSTALATDLGHEDDFSDDELFNDNDLLDDVLSSELEEALDDELENFADLDDDMLVPDEELDGLGDDFETGSRELDQDELDSLFDSDDLTDSALASSDEDDFGGFDLSSDDEFDISDSDLSSAGFEQDEDSDFGLGDEESDAGATASELPEEEAASVIDTGSTDNQGDEAQSAAEKLPSVDDQDDKPEITIDDLLEDAKQPTLADTLGMDDDTVNEEMLERLDREIHQQNQELDRLTDNIISEIEQLEMMGGMLPEDEEDEDDSEPLSSTAKPSPQAIQDLDALAEELDEIDIEDMANADDFNDPLSDELIAELQADDEEHQYSTEQEAVDVFDTELDVLPEEDSAGDALADELLAELTAEDEAENNQLDALSDELLAELESDTSDLTLDDESEAELAEQQPEEAEQAEPLQAEPLQAEPTQVDLTEEQPLEKPEEPELLPASEASDDLTPTEELPHPETSENEEHSALSSQEAGEETETDPLDDALKAFDEQMMEDIPSFTTRAEASAEDFDDTLLDEDFDETDAQDSAEFDDVDEFSLEQEVDGVEKPTLNLQLDDDINELEDVPGLDDWLNDSKDSKDDAILDELEHSEFDDLLQAIDAESEPDEKQVSLALDNPDLDLEALLNDDQDSDLALDEPDESEQDYVDVETLMDDSMQSDEADFAEPPLDLKVSLADFTGVGEDDDVIDIDKDAGQSANLDLARVYIEMDDLTAARELLEEVLEKGSTEHKDEAAKLLQQMVDAE